MAEQKKSLTKDQALQKLQSYCAYQDRCHQEVRTKLLDLGMRGYDLEDIMASLIEENFLNEERFAKSYVRGKFRMKQWGKVKIKLELKKKNISKYCIKSGFKEIDDQDYYDTLLAVIDKKAKRTKEPNAYKKRSKIAKYVIDRGFESGLVWETLKEMEF